MPEYPVRVKRKLNLAKQNHKIEILLGLRQSNAEEIQKVSTFGTQENAYMRMVLSYWDMAAFLNPTSHQIVRLRLQ